MLVLRQAKFWTGGERARRLASTATCLPPSHQLWRTRCASSSSTTTASTTASSTSSTSSSTSTSSAADEEGSAQGLGDAAAGASGRKARRRAQVQAALKAGALGMGFSAGGFIYPYHLGVLWMLREIKILPPPGHPEALKLAGSSAGSLAIATYACGLDVDKATQALLAFAADCRAHGTRSRISPLLHDFLHKYLPDDAHERCSGITYVSITRLFPVWQPQQISQFTSKEDLVEALVASCHIPVYANGDWMVKFRGRWCTDGGLTAFIPQPPTPHAVKVCCFPVNEILAESWGRVHPSVQESSPFLSSVLDVSISPDAFSSYPYSYRQLLAWALVPAGDDVLLSLIQQGRRDAAAWAEAMGLLPAAAR